MGPSLRLVTVSIPRILRGGIKRTVTYAVLRGERRHGTPQHSAALRSCGLPSWPPLGKRILKRWWSVRVRSRAHIVRTPRVRVALGQAMVLWPLSPSHTLAGTT